MPLKERRFYEFGPFVMDAAERILTRQGAPVTLTPKAFDTLLLLVQHAGRTVEKKALLKEVWHDAFVEEGNIAVTISMLRKGLGESSEAPDYI